MARPGLGCPGLHRHRHDLDLCLLPLQVLGTFSSKNRVLAQTLLPVPLRLWVPPVLESVTSLRQASALRVQALFPLQRTLPGFQSGLAISLPAAQAGTSARAPSASGAEEDSGRGCCCSVWAAVTWEAGFPHLGRTLKGPWIAECCLLQPGSKMERTSQLPVLVKLQNDSLQFHN